MKGRRAGWLGWSFSKLTARLFRAKYASSCFRLEKALTNYKPLVTKANPTTNFWTVYKKVADEHDNDMISKYVGGLDTSLIFVSMPMSLVHLTVLNRVLFPC